MNELEWHRQMRGLRTPAAPRRDLWVDIDAALDAARPTIDIAPARRFRRRTWMGAVAASLAGLLLLAAGTSWMLRQQAHDTAPSVAQTPAPATSTLTRWKPADPRLAGAAIELDAARMELRQALRQAPNSDALQRLLDRTERQQAQWRQLEKQAG